MHTEYLLLIILGALLVVNPMVKSLMVRIGIPPLVGYVMLGFAVTGLNRQALVSEDTFEHTFSVLAQLGVVALLFRVGLRSHTRSLLEKLPEASLIWVGDVVTNLAFGFVVSRYVLAWPLETSLVIATALSATSVAVSVAVWDEMKKLQTSVGQLLVDVAELDDLSGVILLAILLAVIPVLHDGEVSIWLPMGAAALAVILKLSLFIAACFAFSRYVEQRFTSFNRRWERSSTGLTITVLGTGLVIAGTAGYLGFSVAIGALFAGLAFSADPEAVKTDARLSNFHEFLTPFFFIYIGMQVEPSSILPSGAVAAVLFVPAVLGKFIGVALPALRVLGRGQAAMLGLSMIPRAEIAMVIVFQCRQLAPEIVPDDVFSAMVIVALATSIVAPVALNSRLKRKPGARRN